MKTKLKKIANKYGHAWVFLYIFIYMPWFILLEKHTGIVGYYAIDTRFDELIPFNEYFIIPYMLWFVLVAGVVLYFFFKDETKVEFYRLTAMLFIGMTVCLFIYTIFPNGQNLRPFMFERNNVFIDMVRTLYRNDTPTNVFPSIHVYNSICVCIGVSGSKLFANKKIAKYGIYTLSLLIILSTMFLKQHSVLDVIGATILAGVTYAFVYGVILKTGEAKKGAVAID